MNGHGLSDLIGEIANLIGHAAIRSLVYRQSTTVIAIAVGLYVIYKASVAWRRRR